MILLLLLKLINSNKRVIINQICNQLIQIRLEKKKLHTQIKEEINQRVKLLDSNKLDYYRQNWMKLENKFKSNFNILKINKRFYIEFVYLS